MLADFFNKQTVKPISKSIVLQAHPLDMSAPNRRPSVMSPKQMKDAEEAELLAKAEKEIPEPVFKEKSFCLDDIFTEIIIDQPVFAQQV